MKIKRVFLWLLRRLALCDILSFSLFPSSMFTARTSKVESKKIQFTFLRRRFKFLASLDNTYDCATLYVSVTLCYCLLLQKIIWDCCLVSVEVTEKQRKRSIVAWTICS